MSIPRILHQLWIGDASKAPTKFMATWRDMCAQHKFEYIFWNESEIAKRREENPEFLLAYSLVEKRVNEMEEINGKADIIRWAILKVYGGVFCDADSICVAPIDDALMSVKEGAFAGYENERVRGAGWSPHYPEIHSHKHALIALGCVGFPPKHPLVIAANRWIVENPVSVAVVGQRAWYSVGPGLITRLFYNPDNVGTDVCALKVFPSHYFLPMHYSGANYYGHGKVYAYQEWGSTKRSYDTMNEVELPRELGEPPSTDAHTILMPSYNTKAMYLRDCMESIKSQQGHFWIDVVCVDDGSDVLHKRILKRMLKELEASSRWIRVHYYENDTNKGITHTLAKGLIECSNELVFRMDTDDIMHPTRMVRQIEYMRENPDAMLCGTQVHMFDTNTGRISGTTSHPKVISWSDFLRRPSHWIANHPTYCFRRDAIMEIGGYNVNIHSVCEDFDLLLRVMRKYGSVHNLPEALLHYRLHDAQITKQLRVSGGQTDWTGVRNAIIEHYSREDSLFFHEATKSLHTP